MSDKLQAAIDDVRRADLPDAKPTITFLSSVFMLARAYIDDSDRRAAEERERGLPWHHDWMVSVGFTEQGINGWSRLIDAGTGSIVELSIDHDGAASLCQDDDHVTITSATYKTRGQILDLLRAMGVRTCP